MAWEITQRNQKNITYEDGDKRACWSTTAIVGYASDPDGAIDNLVDFTPERITAGGYDGWRVDSGPFSYFLGQRPGFASDGWVGFGGRRGQNVFWFRMVQAGYLHWPTRTWYDRGGSPDYDRVNLGRETVTIENPTGHSLNVETIATWSDIWTAGGGALSVAWRAHGGGLKEEILIDQAGRDALETAYPTGNPTDETYLAFVFRVDFGDIPRVYLADTLKDIDTDWSDDETENVYLRDGLDQLLALLPLDHAFVRDTDGQVAVDEDDIPITVAIRKRFYEDGGNYYLVIGCRVDRLQGLPDGTLVFDPTIDVGVGAGDDDTFEAGGAVYDGLTQANVDATDKYHAARFTGISIDSGATIDTAYLTINVYNQNLDEPDHTITGEDAASPLDYSFSGGNPVNPIPSDRDKTTASVSWSSADLGGAGEHNTPSVISIIEELLASYGPYSSGVMAFYIQGSADAARDLGIYYYENSAATAPQLYIEWTASGGGRTTKNTDASPLGLHTAMSWRLN